MRVCACVRACVACVHVRVATLLMCLLQLRPPRRWFGGGVDEGLATDVLNSCGGSLDLARAQVGV